MCSLAELMFNHKQEISSQTTERESDMYKISRRKLQMNAIVIKNKHSDLYRLLKIFSKLEILEKPIFIIKILMIDPKELDSLKRLHKSYRG